MGTVGGLLVINYFCSFDCLFKPLAYLLKRLFVQAPGLFKLSLFTSVSLCVMTSTPPTAPSVRPSAPPATTPASFRDLIGRRVRSSLASAVWPFVWVAILVTAGGVSLRAVSEMTQNPPLPDCSKLSVLSSDSEQLLCARARVQSGSAQALIEAIELVEPWTPANPLYAESNRLMDRWSGALLVELEKMVQRGDRTEALVTVQADETIDYGQVIAVMDQLRTVEGANLGMATQQPAQESP